jgi:DNA-binding HxlR family transcriptional regulator
MVTAYSEAFRRHAVELARLNVKPVSEIADELGINVARLQQWLSEADPEGMPPAEYCPVSIGAKLIGDRWTLLIVRELMVGACRFNQIHRGIPGLSKSLLAGRLKYLERSGIVSHVLPSATDTVGAYHLTEAGLALKSIIEALGEWTIDWRFPRPTDADIDPPLLLWRLSQGLDLSACPSKDICLEFRFMDAEPSHGYITIDRRNVSSSVCIGTPARDTDITITANPRSILEWWYGFSSFAEMVDAGDISVEGPPSLVSQMHTWFRLSQFAPQIRAKNS